MFPVGADFIAEAISEKLKHYVRKYGGFPRFIALKCAIYCIRLAAVGGARPVRDFQLYNARRQSVRHINGGGGNSVIRSRSEGRDRSSIKRIAVVKGDHIGDLIIAIPAFIMLKDAFPNASIVLICSPWNRELAKNFGLFDEIVCTPLDWSGTPRRPLNAAEISASIEIVTALPNFDIAIILKPESINNYLAEHIKADLVAGFGLSKEIGKDVVSHPTRDAYEEMSGEAVHNSELLCSLIGTVISKFYARNIRNSDNILQRVAGLNDLNIQLSGPLIGINMGAGAEARCWPIGHFARLCDLLLKYYPTVNLVIFGDRNESGRAKTLMSLCRNSAQITDLTGKLSLSEFVAWISHLDIFIGHDTGTTHIAAQLCATVCIFSGTNLVDRFGPLGGAVTTICFDMPCAPCGLSLLSDCHHQHSCMTRILPEDVRDEIITLLEKRGVSVVSGAGVI